MVNYAANEYSNPTFGGFPTVMSALAAILVVILLVWALLVVVGARSISTAGRLILAAVAVFVPIIGPLVAIGWVRRTRPRALKIE